MPIGFDLAIDKLVRIAALALLRCKAFADEKTRKLLRHHECPMRLGVGIADRDQITACGLHRGTRANSLDEAISLDRRRMRGHPSAGHQNLIEHFTAENHVVRDTRAVGIGRRRGPRLPSAA